MFSDCNLEGLVFLSRGSGLLPSMGQNNTRWVCAAVQKKKIEYYQQWNLCSVFNPSKCTHTWSSGQPTLWHLGSSWGSVPCSRVSPQSWYWRWRECSLFTPPTYNSCRSWDSNPQPQVTSPTLYPLSHDCPSWSNGSSPARVSEDITRNSWAQVS